MRVTLYVIGHAQEFFPEGKSVHHVILDTPASVRDILVSLGVKPELIMRVASSGGQIFSKDYLPADGEELTLISPPSGG